MPPEWNSEHTPENCFTLFQTLHPAPLRILRTQPHIGPVIGQR